MPGLDGDAIRYRLSEARLYLCTDARRNGGDPGEFTTFVEAALAGGVDVVQLREKGGEPLEARHELDLLEALGDACRRHGALLSVNDRADIALAAGADVLHLGQSDLPVRWARRVVGEEVAIGRSCHDPDQVDAATHEPGVDYFCAGPCWATPTKPGRPATGLDLVRHAAAVAPDDGVGASRPWFAIGGIDETRLPEVVEAGARRIVVVRAITEATDPEAAAHRLADNCRRAA